MATLKKGNIFAHARSSGKTVVFKKKASVKCNPVRPLKARIVKKVVKTAPAKKQFVYVVQHSDSASGPWKTAYGCAMKTDALELAKHIAKLNPKKFIRVI